MNTFVVILSIAVVAFAAPQSPTDPIEILKQDSIINPDGSYQYSYATGNGISADERGALKNIGAEEPALQVEGQYQYPGEDGNNVIVTYIANENGFQPQSAYIPTPPPIPEAIQRSLAYLATLPPSQV